MMRSFQSLFAFLQSYHLLSKMLAIVTTLIIKPKLSKRHKKCLDKKLLLELHELGDTVKKDANILNCKQPHFKKSQIINGIYRKGFCSK